MAEVEVGEGIPIAIQIFERGQSRELKIGQAIAGAIEGDQLRLPPDIEGIKGVVGAPHDGDDAGRPPIGVAHARPKRDCFAGGNKPGTASAEDLHLTGGIFDSKSVRRGGKKEIIGGATAVCDLANGGGKVLAATLGGSGSPVRWEHRAPRNLMSWWERCRPAR